MTDDKTPADIELEDALSSIRGVGENATGNTQVPPATPDEPAESAEPAESEESGEQHPNPPLPDWGSDGVAAEDEPETQ